MSVIQFLRLCLRCRLSAVMTIVHLFTLCLISAETLPLSRLTLYPGYTWCIPGPGRVATRGIFHLTCSVVNTDTQSSSLHPPQETEECNNPTHSAVDKFDRVNPLPLLRTCKQDRDRNPPQVSPPGKTNCLLPSLPPTTAFQFYNKGVFLVPKLFHCAIV